jgi:hypothetical protein
MQQLLPGKQLVFLSICGTSKAIDLGGTIAAQSSWDALKSSLQERLAQGRYSTSLAPLACPGVSKGDIPIQLPQSRQH